jgi:hypothetical protein
VQALRTIYRYWVALLFLPVLVQIGAAGYGAFYAANKSDPGPLSEHQFSHGFDFHDGFGYLVVLGGIVLALLALGARLGRRFALMNFVLLLLLIVQVLLAGFGEDYPVVGIFHPINAFLILGLTGRLAYEAWWGGARLAAATPVA